jgi:hypothetical protein
MKLFHVQVFEWFKRFLEGHKDLEANQVVVSCHSFETAAKDCKLVARHHQVTFSLLENQLDIRQKITH